MKKKASRFKYGLLAGAVAVITFSAGIIYGWGAGRVRDTGYGIRECFNPLTIRRVWKARQFEKRLAGELYGYKSSVGTYGSGAGPDDYEVHARASNRIFGKDGLAEFNGQKGMQAEEYVLAIKKITGKDVSINQEDIGNLHGLDVMSRFIENVPEKTLEAAALNWDSDVVESQESP